MDITEIKQYQQNRHPLLFIDKIIKHKPAQFATSLKCFSYNEWFFPAHFEDEPNVPGFILVEMMVQTFIMTVLTLPQYKGQKTNFAKINNVKFTEKVVPGDSIISEAMLTKFRHGVATGTVESRNQDKLVCKGDFTIVLPTAIPTINK